MVVMVLGLFRGNILYYPGCLTKFVAKELQDNYKKILNRIGVDFIELKDLEVCCGSPVANAGYKKEAKRLAEKNFNIFKEHGVKKVITSCPACFKMFSKDYPDMLEKWDIEVEHITQTIDRAIEKGKLKPKQISSQIRGAVTYHDPCHLGRHCGIYKEPRTVLRSLGLKIIEMFLAKQLALCCGGGAGVKSNYPELANACAKERIDMAKETGAKMLVTTCPMCYLHMKENAKQKDVQVKELSELFTD